eukprot:m.17461 g.17461  ORF g.17461 m.17461 type:complete len:158 (-) comp3590_c0_seq1:126-599(-)
MRLEAIHCSSLRMLCNPTGRSFFLGGGVELPDELLQFGGSAHRSRSTDMADSARRDSDSSTSSSGSSAAAAGWEAGGYSEGRGRRLHPVCISDAKAVLARRMNPSRCQLTAIDCCNALLLLTGQMESKPQSASSAIAHPSSFDALPADTTPAASAVP